MSNHNRRTPAAALCGCGRGRRPHEATCDTCIAALWHALSGVPFVVEQLEISRTRQRSAGIARGAPSSLSLGLVEQLAEILELGRPRIAVPWQEQASTAENRLRDALRVWTRHAHARHWHPRRPAGHAWVPTRDEVADPPTDAAGMARWLLARISHVALDPDGHAAASSITRAHRAAREVVFYKRPARSYLGRCNLVTTYRQADLEPACDGDVYADEVADVGACLKCGREITVSIRKAHLEQLLDDRLCTAAEIATYAVFLGIPASRDRVRTQIATWKKRGRITPRSGPDGDRFRYGDVVPLLYATYADPRKADTA